MRESQRLGWRAILALTIWPFVTASGASAQGHVRVNLPAWRESVVMDTIRQDHTITAPPEVVYRAVLDAYHELEIPTGNTDGKAGIIGSEKFERMRRLAGSPMSSLFSCGEGPAGPHADMYRLTIAVVTWVRPREGGGSTLGIAAAAAGQDITGVYKNPRECVSTGRVELKIKDRVEKLVARLPEPLAPPQEKAKLTIQRPVEQMEGSQIPRYPDILRDAGVEGDVLVQFVVTQDGSILDRSLKVVKSTHQLFTDAVAAAVPQMRYAPPQLDGRAVRQLIQQAFAFRMDASEPIVDIVTFAAGPNTVQNGKPIRIIGKP